jgi:hypothetical protein
MDNNFVVFNAEQRIAFVTNIVPTEENQSSEIYAWVRAYLPSVSFERKLQNGWDWIELKSVQKWGGFTIITLPSLN